jgi:hypothetical protein
VRFPVAVQAFIPASAEPELRLVGVQRDWGVAVRLPVNLVIRLEPRACRTARVEGFGSPAEAPIQTRSGAEPVSAGCTSRLRAWCALEAKYL